MYDAATGTLVASTSIYDHISDRSSMAVSDDGSVAIIQERDDTFGHNKVAAYRCSAALRSNRQRVQPLSLPAPQSRPALLLLVR
jgi:hypothetical protein